MMNRILVPRMLLLLFMLIICIPVVDSALVIRRQQQQEQELISKNYIYNGTVTQNYSSNQSQQYPVQTVFVSSTLEHTIVSNLVVMLPPRYCQSLCENMTYCTNSIINNSNVSSLSNEENSVQSIALVLDVNNPVQQPICSLEEKLNNIRYLNEILSPHMMHVKFIVLEQLWGARSIDIVDLSSISLPANISLITASNDTINDIVRTVKSYTDVNYTEESRSPYLLDEASHKWNLTFSLNVDLLINTSTESIAVTNTTTGSTAVPNTPVTTTESTQQRYGNTGARVFLTSIIVIFIVVWVTICLVNINNIHKGTETLSPIEQDILRRETERQIQLLKKKYKNRLTEMEFNTLPIRQYDHDLYHQIHGIKNRASDHETSNITNATTTIDNEDKVSICDEIEKSTHSGSAVVIGRQLLTQSAPNLYHCHSESVDRTTSNTDSNSSIKVSRRNLFHKMMSNDLKLFQSKDECTTSSIHNKKDVDEIAANNSTDVEAHLDYGIDNKIDPDESSDDDDDEGSCCGKCRQDHDDYDDVCPICIEEFVHGENVIVLPSCNHIFHKDCIQLWLIKKRGSCPMCKVIVLNEQQLKDREQRIILIATERAMEIFRRI